MSEGAAMLLELYRRHMYAVRDGDHKLRKRLFALIDEFEWAFPSIKAELNTLYPPPAQEEADE